MKLPAISYETRFVVGVIALSLGLVAAYLMAYLSGALNYLVRIITPGEKYKGRKPSNFHPILIWIVFVISIIGSVLAGAFFQSAPVLSVSQENPNNFLYVVRILDNATGKPVANIRIQIEINGEPPLSRLSDSSGIASFSLSSSIVGQSAKIMIIADGYQPYSQEIVIHRESQPNTIQLNAESISVLLTTTQIPITPLPSHTPPKPASASPGIADNPTPAALQTKPADEEAPSYPIGFELFDEFSTNGFLDLSVWNDPELPTDCLNQIKQSYYLIDCKSSNGDVKFGLVPRDVNNLTPRRIAAAIQIIESSQNSSINLVIAFSDREGKRLPTYYLQLSSENNQVPSEHYQVFNLAQETYVRTIFTQKINISSGVVHVVQIEYESGTLEFFIDGAKILLDQPPDLPTDASVFDWKIEPYIYGTGSTLLAKIYWVALRE